MKICDTIQERLAEAGAAALRDDAEARQHLESCADCSKVLADLARLDAALADLPTPDASDELVERTLEKVRLAAAWQPQPQPDRARRRVVVRVVARGLAASVVLVASVGLIQFLLSPGRDPISAHLNQLHSVGAENPQKQVAQVTELESGSRELSLDETREVDRLRNERAGADVGEAAQDTRHAQKAAEGPDPALQEGAFEMIVGETSIDAPSGFDSTDRPSEESLLIARLQSRFGNTETAGLERDLISQSGSLEHFAPDAPPAPGAKAKADDGEEDLYRGNDPVETKDRAKAPAEVGVVGGVLPLPEGEPASSFRADQPLSKSEAEKPASLEQNRDLQAQDKKRESGRGGGYFFGDEDARRRSSVASAITEDADLQARAFLQQSERLDFPEGFIFQEPRGYWANTYIPGDPAMRLLQMRLRDWDRVVLGSDLRLERDVRQVGQPFDAPAQGAMALYLHADRAAIEGPARLRLQVGLKGAERQGGHRPAMNLGLVIDPRALADAEAGARLRALITALERARQPGDRFSLTVAGPDGGLLVPPEDFRHGPLRVAVERIFETAPDLRNDPADLPRAVTLAAESVRRGDDPDAVLGSSLVLLVTGSALAGELPALERLAHANAVGGVPLSAVALGASANLTEIDRLVAAGQGNRRILESAAGADGLIDRELHAASRAVARALRLRIRLAPGVRLIRVLGSRRLGEPQAEQVREAEQAIDQRLARNLGIEADRGEDEDGIQIVIPNFYAGDSHVVLLDVVAEGPGPIADVQLRYKDVVQLRNGVAEAALALDSGTKAAGPLERNVLKNLVAWQFAEESRRISWLIETGQHQAAAFLLAQQRDLIRGLRREVPGWSANPELAADEALLGEYLAALGRPAAGDALHRRYLADSLRYAGYRKLQTAAR